MLLLADVPIGSRVSPADPAFTIKYLGKSPDSGTIVATTLSVIGSEFGVSNSIAWRASSHLPHSCCG